MSRTRLAERLAKEGLRLARLWRPAVVSAFHPIREEPDTLALLDALSTEGYATALPVVVGRGSPLTFRLWRPGEPTLPGGMGIPEPLELGVRPSTRISCSCRSPASIGGAIASGTARAITTAAWRG